jgi:Protein-tyrosine-phosphatase
MPLLFVEDERRENVSETKIVQFICTGNYYRSRYAELYFNARVAEDSGWRADSRGFAPTPLNPGSISQKTLERIKAGGYRYDQAAVERKPLLLQEEDLKQASYIVALDKSEHTPYVKRMFPEWMDRFHFWVIPDIGFMTVDAALAGIEQAVDQLIDELGIKRA